MLVAAVGDVHGRFFRVEEWIDTLEQSRGERVAAVLSVGDVETFSTADDHRRKATKRTMPAEFAAYARGERDVGTLEDLVRGRLPVVPEYASLRGADDLVDVGAQLLPNSPAVLAVALRIGATRLIDNTVLGEPDPGLDPS